MILVHVVYIPGCAGNFLARCLGLNDRVLSYFKDYNPWRPVEEKLKEYSYKRVTGEMWKPGYTKNRVWQQFERSLTQIDITYKEAPVCPGITHIVQTSHPHTDEYDVKIGDHRHVLIVDDIPEISLSNCEAKSADRRLEYYTFYDEMITDPYVIQFKFSSFLIKESFIDAYRTLCSSLEIPEKYQKIDAVCTLYDQWFKTLPVNPIKEAK